MKNLLLLALMGVITLSSCVSINGYPKVKELGLVNVDVETLPNISVIIGDEPDLAFEAASTSWQFGYRSKLSVGQRIDLDRDGVITYRLDENLEDLGVQRWFFEWSHPEYGFGSKFVEYKGDPVYAIRKKNYSLGLIPKEGS